MATFPTSLPTFADPSPPGPGQYVWLDGTVRDAIEAPATILIASDPDKVHSTLTKKQSDELAAVAAKVGVDSSAVTTSLDYLVKSASSSNPGHRHTTAHVTASTDKNFVTDAQLVVIGNTSGTNTGDQSLFRTIAVSGQSDVVADSATDTLTFVAGTNVTITTNATTDTITISASGGGGGLSDGDYGDITVGGSGTTMTIDSDTVTYAKMQNVSATDRLLGRSSSGSGDVEEIPCTAAGRALIDDSTAAAQRVTLGVSSRAIIFGAVTPGNDTLYLTTYAPFAFTIDSVQNIQTSAGTITAAVKINGTNVTGLSAISVTSSSQDVTASGANSVAVGDEVTVVLSSNSSAANLRGTILITV